jgi:membrane-associated phospholipid phosphatase
VVVPAAPAAAAVPDPYLRGAAMGGTLVGAILLDDALRSRLAAPHPDDPVPLARVANYFGNGRIAVLAIGGAYAGARLAGLDEVRGPAGRTLVALVSAGAVNGAVKVAVGRARPRLEEGSAAFRPFSLDNGWQAFPSGHAVTAFALAAVLAEEVGGPWATALGYGAAGVVGWSRIHEDRHWTSDVVGGAIGGAVVAGSTVRWLQRRERDGEPAARPRLLVVPGRLGVAWPVP